MGSVSQQHRDALGRLRQGAQAARDGPHLHAAGQGRLHHRRALWLPGQAIYYINGSETARWENERISKVPSCLLFTLPQGDWDNNAVDNSKLPADFTIDYLRIWQRKELSPNEPASAKP